MLGNLVVLFKLPWNCKSSTHRVASPFQEILFIIQVLIHQRIKLVHLYSEGACDVELVLGKSFHIARSFDDVEFE